MKSILFATALSVAAASSAFAGMASDQLSASTLAVVQQLAPNASFSSLSSAQISRIQSLVHNPENLKPTNNPADALNVILTQN